MDIIQCAHCTRKFDTEDSLRQHEKAKHEVSSEEKRKSSSKRIKKYFFIMLILLAIVLFSYTFYVRAQRPGDYDDFAKCLAKKGAVMYGNDYCEYTTKQRNYFGKSEKYLNYVKCIDNTNLCNQKGVKVTPTWEINGKMYPQVQTFEQLSELTGCKL